MIGMLLLAQAIIASPLPILAPSAPPPPIPFSGPVVIPSPLQTNTLPRGPLPKQEGGLWIKYGDYPVAALQKGEGGVAGFTLSVDARGAVTKCALTSTSGSAALDKATCDLLLQRAAFSSALDGAGRPVTGSYSGAVRWVLPAPGRLARQGAFSYSYIVETDGTVSHCSLLQANGTMATRAQTYMGPCPLRVQEPYIDDRGNPVARKVTVINSVSIDPLP